MRQKLLVLVVAMGVLLAACGPASVDPTANPDTQPTVTHGDVLDTRPTGDAGQQADYTWLVKHEWENLSYEEYFSEARSFSKKACREVNSRQVGDSTEYITESYALCLDENGFYIVHLQGDRLPASVTGIRHGRDAFVLAGTQGEETYPVIWEVPNSQELGQINAYITDWEYAYCVRNENEIISVNLITGEVETLVSGVSIPVRNLDCIALYDQTLLYLTEYENKIHINRLYLPEMITDVLYEDISADGFVCEFYVDYPDSDSLVWRVFDAELIPQVLAILQDPDSDYRKYIPKPEELWGLTDIDAIAAHEGFMTLAQMIEIHKEIPALIYCEYHIPQERLIQEARYWGT